MLSVIEQKVLSRQGISRSEALFLADIAGPDLMKLHASADAIRRHFRGDSVDLCSIINAKSGLCGENCSFCSQSAGSSSDIPRFGLLQKDAIAASARAARSGGAKRFCIVTSGRRVSASELTGICDAVAEVRDIGLLPCATLGLLNEEDLARLKKAGLERYHNNLETSENFFPQICTSHTYQDKIGTIRAAADAGLSICCGGIFGLGETWHDRIDLAFALRDLPVDSVPLNFLTPITGTRLENMKPIEALDALKIISIFRFILPKKEIRVCGGRLQTLGDLHALIFFAGADGLLTGNYLTTLGRDFSDDLKLISRCGLRAG